jgi:WD40 repeat protein
MGAVNVKVKGKDLGGFAMGKMVPIYFTLILSMLTMTSFGSRKGESGKTPKPCVSPDKYIQIEITSQERPLSGLDILLERRLSKLEISPDGRYLLGSLRKGVVLWDVEAGKEIHTYPPPGPFFLPSGQLACFRGDKLLVSQSGQWTEFSPMAKLEGDTLSPDGRYIAHFEYPEDNPSGLGYRVTFRQIPSGQKVSTLPPFKAFEMSTAFSPDSQLFAIATEDGKLTVWRVKDGQLVRTFKLGTQSVWHTGWGKVTKEGVRAFDLAFSPDGRILASANDDSTLKLWDISTGKLSKSFKLGIDQVAFTPDGRFLIAVGTENFWVWDLKQEKVICHDCEGYVRKMALSANGKVLAIYEGPSRGRIAVYDVTKLVQGKNRSSSAEKQQSQGS